MRAVNIMLAKDLFQSFDDKLKFENLFYGVQSWQLLELATTIPVVFVKIVGTHNSANEVFHCVHFECPADANALPPDDRSVLPKDVVVNEEMEP
ncbi:hypothetical protein DICVIV_09958 [Dictyocaulus viviparus]|uniref:Uncharacterized protein n=1 Tax=Dictyocaulus viviparus TaxID=29172 RepID=A0A0D8XHE4_DICVI|nr:hypothetical protein DICVIV_09958 [Dictyocaulus viviparus]